MENNLTILPFELQNEVKKYLNNNDLNSYGRTCHMIRLSYTPEIEKQLRNCKLYNIPVDELKERWYYCGHLDCVKYSISILKEDYKACYGGKYSIPTIAFDRICSSGNIDSVKFVTEYMDPHGFNNLRFYDLLFYDVEVFDYCVDTFNIKKECLFVNHLTAYYERRDITKFEKLIEKTDKDYGKNAITIDRINHILDKFNVTFEDLVHLEYSYIFRACVYDNVNAVRFLIDKYDLSNMNENSIFYYGNKLLSSCTKFGKGFTVFKYLVELGFNKQHFKNKISKAINNLIVFDKFEFLCYLFETFNLDITYVMANNYRHLKNAFEGSHLKILKYLVDKFKIHPKNAVSSAKFTKVGAKYTLETIKYMVENGGITEDNIFAPGDYSLLLFKIKETYGKDINAVKYLIEKFNVNVKDFLNRPGNEKLLSSKLRGEYHKEVKDYLISFLDTEDKQKHKVKESKIVKSRKYTVKCKALTTRYKQCKNKPNFDGYCNIHKSK